MLRWAFMVSAIVFAQHSMASWGVSPEEGPLGITPSAQQQLYDSQAEARGRNPDRLANLEVDLNAAADVGQIIDKNFGSKCDNFAGDGEVNKWGRIIEKELNKDRHRALYEGPADVRHECPKYTSLNDEDKKGLWILIISAMTHYESSCIVSESTKGPNGTAAGLLQLHRGKEASYSNGCRNGDSATAERSLICGISMVNDQVERGEPLFSRNSYWDVLRPQGPSGKSYNIRSLIRKFPACVTGKSTDGSIPLNIRPDTLKKIRPARKGKQVSHKLTVKKKVRVADSSNR